MVLTSFSGLLARAPGDIVLNKKVSYRKQIKRQHSWSTL